MDRLLVTRTIKVLILAALTGSGAGTAQAENTYLACTDGNVIEISPEEGRAYIAVIDSEPIVLNREPGNYNNADGYELEETDDGWTLWTSEGSADCRRHIPGEPLPGGQDEGSRDQLNIAAQSWGGRVRSGPGMNFEHIGSLSEGEPITLIRNTGRVFNEYDWFEIRFQGGHTGYQWGGIICSDVANVPGTFSPCTGNPEL